MKALPDELILLAAEYALGTADGVDAARAARLERENPSFRAEVMQWREKLSAFDEGTMPLPPSSDLWQKIEARLGDAALPDTSPAQQAKPYHPGKTFWTKSIWNSLTFWRGMGMVTALASMLLAFGFASQINRASLSPIYVAVLNTADGRAAAVVNAFTDGRVELIPLEVIPVPEGRIIEVWTLQDRAQGPVSIGRMEQARTLPLNLRDLGKPDVNHLFELTLEPQGGSPTGKPTGPILMKGLIAKSV